MNADNLLDFGTDILVTPAGYVDKPGEAVFTVQIASGDLLVRVPLKFREDSDFLVRAIKAAAVDAGIPGSSNLGKALGFSFRFSDSEGRYLSNMQADYQLAAGSATLPKDLAIPLVVPSGGVLLLDLTADTDTSSGALVTTQVPTNLTEPWGICYDNNGNVWSVDTVSGSILKIDVATQAIIATVPALANARACCYDAGTNTVWVMYGSPSPATVAKINPVTNAVIGSYNVGSGSGNVVSDGTRIWCCNANDDTVTVLLAADGSLVATVNVGNSPNGICYDAGTGTVWVANQFGASVTKVTAATQIVVGTYTVGSGPIGIVSDGTDIWVSDGGYVGTGFLQSLERVSLTTGAVLNTYILGDDGTLDTLAGMAWDSVRGILWLCDGGGNAEHNFIYAIDPATGTITATYDAQTNGLPFEVCVAGDTVWASNNNVGFLTELSPGASSFVATQAQIVFCGVRRFRGVA